MTAETLRIYNDDTSVEIFLNAKGEIYVGEISEDPAAFCFVINQEDWEKVKQFIDKQFLPF